MKNTIFKEIGFGEKEALLYQALLKIGHASSSLVSKETGIPRQTAYGILKDMAARGYIEITEEAGVKKFVADPNSLLLVLEKERIDLEKKKQLVEEQIPYLNTLRQRKTKPGVRVFDGDDGLKMMLENILDYYKKGGEKEFRAMGINRLRETSINTFIRSFLKRRNDYGVKTKLIVAQSEDDFDIKKAEELMGRDIRKIDIDEQKAGMYIAGEKVFFFSFDDRTGTMIENSSIAKLLRDYFDHTWKQTGN